MWLAFIDEEKKGYWKITITLIQTMHSNCIALHVGKQRVCSAEVEALAPVFKKSVTKTKPNLLRCKNTVNIVVNFNIRRLTKVNQLPKLTVSAAE